MESQVVVEDRRPKVADAVGFCELPENSLFEYAQGDSSCIYWKLPSPCSTGINTVGFSLTGTRTVSTFNAAA